MDYHWKVISYDAKGKNFVLEKNSPKLCTSYNTAGFENVVSIDSGLKSLQNKKVDDDSNTSKKNVSMEAQYKVCVNTGDIVTTQRDSDTGNSTKLDINEICGSTEKDRGSPAEYSSGFCSVVGHIGDSNLTVTSQNQEHHEAGIVAIPHGDVSLTVTEYDQGQGDVKRKCVQLAFSLSKLKARLKGRTENRDTKERTNVFHAKISPTDNQAAENELRKSVDSINFSLHKFFETGYVCEPM